MRYILLWCSGSSRELLKQCSERENIRQSIIGAFVLCTAVAAFLSAHYSTLAISNSPEWAIGCASIWAMLILTLDRFLVSSGRAYKAKDGSFKTGSWTMVPRILLSLIIGFLIGIPVELFVFRAEITAAIEAEGDQKITANAFATAAMKGDHCEKFYLTKSTDARKSISHWQAMISNTTESRDGTGKGCDIVCRGYMMQLSNSTRELENISESVSKCQAQANPIELKDYSEIQAVIEKDRRFEERARKNRELPSLLTQYEALVKLSKAPGKENIQYATYLIPLIFILFEVTPVLAKALSGTGQYDILSYIEYERTVAYANELDVEYSSRLATQRLSFEHLVERTRREYDSIWKHIERLSDQFHNEANTRAEKHFQDRKPSPPTPELDRHYLDIALERFFRSLSAHISKEKPSTMSRNIYASADGVPTANPHDAAPSHNFPQGTSGTRHEAPTDSDISLKERNDEKAEAAVPIAAKSPFKSRFSTFTESYIKKAGDIAATKSFELWETVLNFIGPVIPLCAAIFGSLKFGAPESMVFGVLIFGLLGGALFSVILRNRSPSKVTAAYV